MVSSLVFTRKRCINFTLGAKHALTVNCFELAFVATLHRFRIVKECLRLTNTSRLRRQRFAKTRRNSDCSCSIFMGFAT
jgi:hypothetical protein